MIKAITDIVNQLIKSFDRGEPLNLSKLKMNVAAKYKLSGAPKIVDILAALPESHKE